MDISIEDMLVVVCYDVNTETKEGQRRLRRVAKVCEAVGQRVQKSVFECRIDLAQLETLERNLLEEIDTTTDCLRFYRIKNPGSLNVKEYGAFKATDFNDTLII